MENYDYEKFSEEFDNISNKGFVISECINSIMWCYNGIYTTASNLCPRKDKKE